MYKECKECHICNKPFNTNKKVNIIKILKHFQIFKTLDHCHYPGKYRGAAHYLCNLSLRYQEQRNIPIVIHNGSKYDFLLLIKDLAKEFKSQIKCIGGNTDTYATFLLPLEIETDEEDEKGNKKTKKYNLRFIDTYRFMNRSLDVLVDNLSQINDKTCKKCKERIKTTQYYKFNKLDRDKLMCKC